MGQRQVSTTTSHHVHTFIWRRPGDNLLPPAETEHMASCSCGMTIGGWSA